jgi:hypothetical protein
MAILTARRQLPVALSEIDEANAGIGVHDVIARETWLNGITRGNILVVRNDVSSDHAGKQLQNDTSGQVGA